MLVLCDCAIQAVFEPYKMPEIILCLGLWASVDLDMGISRYSWDRV